MKYKAFISYRRSDSSERAQLVKLAIMEQGYAEDDIFLDLHSIHEGEFPKHIREALEDTEFFILLLSKDSFNKNVENDYYIDEIKCALDLNLRIIPVVFDSLNVDSLPIPQVLIDKNLKLKNSIPYYPEYPEAFRKKLAEFMKPDSRSLLDLIKMPALILTIYAVVSLLAGVGMWIIDNLFMSEEIQVETVADNLQIGDGQLAYSVPGQTYVYDTKTHEIQCFEGCGNMIISGSVSTSQITQVGFWTVSVGLVYELTRTKLKPHGNWRSALAYIAVGVSVVAGFGFGATLERMFFPKQYALPIRDKLNSSEFWQKVVNKKYSRYNMSFIE